AARAFQAAALLSPGDDARVRRTMGAGRALWLAGEGERAAALLESVLDLAADPAARADLQQIRGLAMLFTSPVPETLAMLVTEAGRGGARGGAARRGARSGSARKRRVHVLHRGRSGGRRRDGPPGPGRGRTRRPADPYDGPRPRDRRQRSSR